MSTTLNNQLNRVKTAADQYITSCFAGPLPPKQEIEIRLAFYAGMHTSLQYLLDLAITDIDEVDMEIALLTFGQAIIARGKTLNEVRTK